MSAPAGSPQWQAAGVAAALARYRQAKHDVEATRDGGSTDAEIDAYADAIDAADEFIALALLEGIPS